MFTTKYKKWLVYVIIYSLFDKVCDSVYNFLRFTWLNQLDILNNFSDTSQSKTHNNLKPVTNKFSHVTLYRENISLVPSR